MFGYGGLYADIAYRNVTVTPLAGLGGYRQKDSSELGGVFQFRLSLEVSHVFANRHRFGLNLAHISNASIHDRNPGGEELYMTYAIPFCPGRLDASARSPRVQTLRGTARD